jgi:hypothetical protein
MKISTQTCYYSDALEDVSIDVTSEGKVTLWGFDAHPFKPKDLRKLAIFIEHVAAIHTSIFDDDDEPATTGVPGKDPRQLDLFAGGTD